MNEESFDLGNVKVEPHEVRLSRKGHAEKDNRHGDTHVGHPGTGRKNVKASQMLSSIRMNSHWGQLDMMSCREEHLPS